VEHCNILPTCICVAVLITSVQRLHIIFRKKVFRVHNAADFLKSESSLKSSNINHLTEESDVKLGVSEVVMY
jgi:hypothetical protein